MWVTENPMMWLHPEPPRTQSQTRNAHSQNVPGATSEKDPGVRAGPALARVPSSMFQILMSSFSFSGKRHSVIFTLLNELTFSYFCSSFV